MAYSDSVPVRNNCLPSIMHWAKSVHLLTIKKQFKKIMLFVSKRKNVASGGGKKSQSLLAAVVRREVGICRREEDDGGILRAQDQEASVAAILRLRQGESQADFKRWIINIIAIQEKKVEESKHSINETKKQIQFNRMVSPDAMDMEVFLCMKRTQGFEARLAKGNQLISDLQAILVEMKGDTSKGRKVMNTLEERVVDLLNTPTIRPGLESPAAA
jgi:uncharacterized coiled-coil protein SlyX